MQFEFPQGFDQLPPEIQDTIRKSMIQDLFIHMHLGKEYLDVIKKITLSVNKVVSDPKYKDDPIILNLENEVSDILNSLKTIMEQCSAELNSE